MESTKGNMNMHFETIANNQSCNAVLKAKIARHAGTRRKAHHILHYLFFNDTTVAARNQQATKRDLESSNTTNGHTCNADLRRLRPLHSPWRRSTSTNYHWP